MYVAQVSSHHFHVSWASPFPHFPTLQVPSVCRDSCVDFMPSTQVSGHSSISHCLCLLSSVWNYRNNWQLLNALRNLAMCFVWISHLTIYHSPVVVLPLIRTWKLRHIEIMSVTCSGVLLVRRCEPSILSLHPLSFPACSAPPGTSCSGCLLSLSIPQAAGLLLPEV